MPPGTDLDIYQRFERELRTPKRRLLLDAFLPAPESIESAVAQPPPPPPLPGESAEEFGRLSLRDREEPAPPPKPRRKKSAPPKNEKPKSLQEEIEEFMTRDGAGLAPEDDIGPFQRPVPDPNTDPEPEK